VLAAEVDVGTGVWLEEWERTMEREMGVVSWSGSGRWECGRVVDRDWKELRMERMAEARERVLGTVMGLARVRWESGRRGR
jgi:hypothetical protein